MSGIVRRQPLANSGNNTAASNNSNLNRGFDKFENPDTVATIISNPTN